MCYRLDRENLRFNFFFRLPIPSPQSFGMILCLTRTISPTFPVIFHVIVFWEGMLAWSKIVKVMHCKVLFQLSESLQFTAFDFFAMQVNVDVHMELVHMRRMCEGSWMFLHKLCFILQLIFLFDL